jgi:hypothetical protein
MAPTIDMAQHNIGAILGWWLTEGQGNKKWAPRSGRAVPTIQPTAPRAKLKPMSTTAVYRVYCTAGMPITRGRNPPVKMVTVYFPGAVLQKLSSAQAQTRAIEYGSKLLRNEVLNDPQFKEGAQWEAKKEDVNLSGYLTPNLQGKDGAKAWFN